MKGRKIVWSVLAIGGIITVFALLNAIFRSIGAVTVEKSLLETPYLVAASQSNPGGVVFVGLNVLEYPSAVSNYKDEFQVPYPLVLDPQGDITGIYKPVGIPTSWFIDAEGIVRYVHSGPMTGEMIQQILDSIRSRESISGM